MSGDRKNTKGFSIRKVGQQSQDRQGEALYKALLELCKDSKYSGSEEAVFRSRRESFWLLNDDMA